MPASVPTKAIILTAGEGAHFHPLTVTRPKGMSIVAGKPILQHTVEALVEAGIKECWFVVGYKPERIRTFFGNGSSFGFTAHYVEQPQPEGTGAAVRLAARDVQPTSEMLVIFGDNHYTADLVRTVLSIQGDVILGTSNADPVRNGLLVAKAGKLVRYEFPSTSERGLVNTGLMKFTPEFFDFLAKRPMAEAAQLPQVVEAYVQGGATVQVPTADQGWDEADTVWELLRMNERLLGEGEAETTTTLPGVRVEGSVVIGKNTRIHPGTQLIGPLYIGADCEIRENAILGPYVSLRNSVHVGAHSEVRHSIVNNNVYIDSQCVIRFSILDDGVHLGPFGVIAEGNVTNPEQLLPARRGAVIGPDMQFGARVTIPPGSILSNADEVAAAQTVKPLRQRA